MELLFGFPLIRRMPKSSKRKRKRELIPKEHSEEFLTKVLVIASYSIGIVAIIILFVAVGTLVANVPDYWEEQDAVHWAKTEGTLLERSSHYKATAQPQGRREWVPHVAREYFTYVKYQYTVNGIEYIGYRERIRLGDSRKYKRYPLDTSRDFLLSLMYRARQQNDKDCDRKVDVYYNPLNPQQSVLFKDTPNSPWTAIVACLFIAFGIAVFLMILYRNRRR